MAETYDQGWIDPSRVAEVIVDRGAGIRGARGSGYRVTATAVLTAAHVLAGALAVRVRFNADQPDEWVVSASTWEADSLPGGTDLAILTIAAPSNEDPVQPVAFGRLTRRDVDANCRCVGFPRFKLRADQTTRIAVDLQAADAGQVTRYRDSRLAVGSIALLSNLREGTLEVSVPPPDRDDDPNVSPWEGMSGAAVWVAGCIVGVIAEHHRPDGLGTLAAVPIDLCYPAPGSKELVAIKALLGLPNDVSLLPDVTPLSPADRALARHREYARSLAPDELLDRAPDLAKLAAFCAEGEAYAWWQAGPWAGKTALAAWFVLHPPKDVEVVSFFVIGRLAERSDSPAFSQAMSEQLAALVGEPQPVVPVADEELDRLLVAACVRAAQRGRRLVLVVDGLDEDQGARPHSGRHSVAAMLPDKPHPALRVLVMSRPFPGIPTDVADDHPLRQCVPRILTPYRRAGDLLGRAKGEVYEALNGDQIDADILVFLTAADDGLSVDELAELVGQLRPRVESRLASAFGRTLRRITVDSLLRPDVVYLFANEILIDAARDQIGATHVGRYRDRIHAWADTYRDRDWPESTPGYLLRGYSRLLVDSGQLPRLLALVTDSSRQRRLFLASGGDAAALAEITAAQDVALQRPGSELTTLSVLAASRHQLIVRNWNVPPELPIVWAQVGEFGRAEALARSLREEHRSDALVALASALTEAGQWKQAEALAAILPADRQPEALVAVATALPTTQVVAAGRLMARAEEVARSLPADDYEKEKQRERALAVVAGALAESGALDQAEAIAYSFSDFRREPAATAVVGALVKARHIERAKALAFSVDESFHQGDAVAAVAAAMAKQGDFAAAQALADDLSYMKDAVIIAVVRELVRAGQIDHAESVARSLTSDYNRKRALLIVARAGALAGEFDRAEAIARELDEDDQASMRAAVVTAMARAGMWDRAESIARAAAQNDRQEWRVREMAGAVARAGNPALAETLARLIPVEGRPVALATVAQAVATSHEATARHLADQAEELAHNLPNNEQRAQAIAALVQALASIGDVDRADTLAQRLPQKQREAAFVEIAGAAAKAEQWEQVERLANSCSDPSQRVRALAAAATGKADSAQGLVEQAQILARRLSSPSDQAAATTATARAWACIGEFDKAETLLYELPPAQLASALVEVVDAEARAGAVERAGALAQGLSDEDEQARALTALATALACTGDYDRAEAVVGSIPRYIRPPPFRRDPDHLPPPPDYRRIAAKVAIAHAVARAGDQQRAEAIANSLSATRSHGRAEALLEVARALLIRDPAQALAVGQRAKGILSRVYVGLGRSHDLDTGVPALLALASDRDLTETLARTRPPGQDSAQAEVAIAVREALAVGNEERARQYVAILLAGAGWLHALNGLVALEPEAVRRAADVFLSSERSPASGSVS